MTSARFISIYFYLNIVYNFFTTGKLKFCLDNFSSSLSISETMVLNCIFTGNFFSFECCVSLATWRVSMGSVR